jgi:hypothetical protein
VLCIVSVVSCFGSKSPRICQSNTQLNRLILRGSICFHQQGAHPIGLMDTVTAYLWASSFQPEYFIRLHFFLEAGKRIKWIHALRRNRALVQIVAMGPFPTGCQ